MKGRTDQDARIISRATATMEVRNTSLRNVTISNLVSTNRKTPVLKDRNFRISDKELELLELINNLGPCTSERVHESIDPKFEYLVVMRSMHNLVEKGFLQRVIINKKQLYKTSKNYSYIRSYLDSLNS